MNVHAPEPEVEDDGFITDMSRVLRSNAAPAKPAGGDKPSQPPQSRTERLRASMVSDLDKARAELHIIEVRKIEVEEIDAAAQRQAAAEYVETVAAAKAKMDRVLSRLSEDKEANIAELEASKADVLGIVAILTDGLEGQKSATARSPVEMAS